MKEEFINYLVKKGYSVPTPNGNPSTVYDYPKRIDKVCERENLTWVELARSIEKIVIQYDVNGCNEQFGRQSHGAVINALKRFQEFTTMR